MVHAAPMTTPSSGSEYHVPVLADEVLVALGLGPRSVGPSASRRAPGDSLASGSLVEEPRSGGLWVDGTVGGGGHASRILAATAPAGTLLGIDRDDAALAFAATRLPSRATLVRASFDEIDGVLAESGIAPGTVSGALLDLGVSSRQLDEAARGFSFAADGPLDMRMDRRQSATAADLVNGLSHGELAKILREYGEEKNAGRIATKILEAREKKPFTRTRELVSTVVAAFGGREKKGGIHVATRAFQALRIAVNAELSTLERALPKFLDALAPGGRLAVISFHSLEDRIVKHTFRDWATGCVCPKNVPVCRCGRVPKVSLVTRKGVRAGEVEAKQNPRARSATLRAVMKLGARA